MRTKDIGYAMVGGYNLNIYVYSYNQEDLQMIPNVSPSLLEFYSQPSQ